MGMVGADCLASKRQIPVQQCVDQGSGGPGEQRDLGRGNLKEWRTGKFGEVEGLARVQSSTSVHMPFKNKASRFHSSERHPCQPSRSLRPSAVNNSHALLHTCDYT